MKYCWRLIIIIILVGIVQAPLAAEYFFLNDGTIVNGRISFRDQRGYAVVTRDDRILHLEKKSIIRIRKNDDYKKEKEIRLTRLRWFNAYIVDQDDQTITVRRNIYSSREETIPKNQVVKILPADSRGRLRYSEWNKKREGWYITGFPFVAYNTDNGVIFGGVASFFINGKRSDRFFSREPYNFKVQIISYFSSSEFMRQRLMVDKYHLNGTNIRLQGGLEYEHNINANYYGVGQDVMEHGLVDSNGREFETRMSYQDSFLLKGDKQNLKYNKVQYLAPRLYFNLSGMLFRNIKYLVGLEANYVIINPWDNKTFMYDCEEYRAADDSLITRERPPGFHGGWTNFIRLGIGYDTRDFPPDPNEGVFIDFTFETSGMMVGSEYEYQRYTLGARFYTPVAIDDLVFAARIGFTSAVGDIPFYEMGIFPFMFERKEGLAHNSHLKGYSFARFVGRTQMFYNLELRWKFLELYHAPSQNRFGFKLVAFVDAKNIWDDALDIFLDHRFQYYKLSYGASVIIAWNLATIMRVSFGFSPEDFAISMSFGQTF